MRLICPNCDAQYEVPDEVVPVEGRDVQCSNCGQTWFQHHADHMPDVADDTNPTARAPQDDQAEYDIAPPPPPPEPEREEPKRQELDPTIADILRQEAATEQRARSGRESDPLESQPDLGLDDGNQLDEDARRALEAGQRMARMRGEPDPGSEADASAAALSSRRDLLPDIEEINSTLRNDEERVGTSEEQRLEGATTRKRRRGFRRGLMMMLILFALAILLYILAPRIIAAAPQLEPALSAYIDWVDRLRSWLDVRVRDLAQWLDSAASQSGN